MIKRKQAKRQIEITIASFSQTLKRESDLPKCFPNLPKCLTQR